MAVPTPPAPLRPVVVGVDGSPSSIGALRRGARIAAALRLPLEAVSVWRYPDLNGPAGMTYFPDADVMAASARSVLDESVMTVFGTDVPIWYRGTVRQGVTAQVLMEESQDAEMLVVGSRGHGGFLGLLLGSVSEAVAEHASCPVLVFHEPAPITEAA